MPYQPPNRGLPMLPEGDRAMRIRHRSEPRVRHRFYLRRGDVEHDKSSGSDSHLPDPCCFAGRGLSRVLFGDRQRDRVFKWHAVLRVRGGGMYLQQRGRRCATPGCGIRWGGRLDLPAERDVPVPSSAPRHPVRPPRRAMPLRCVHALLFGRRMGWGVLRATVSDPSVARM
jgi:hypothetical protein